MQRDAVRDLLDARSELVKHRAEIDVNIDAIDRSIAILSGGKTPSMAMAMETAKAAKEALTANGHAVKRPDGDKLKSKQSMVMEAIQAINGKFSTDDICRTTGIEKRLMHPYLSLFAKQKLIKRIFPGTYVINK